MAARIRQWLDGLNDNPVVTLLERRRHAGPEGNLGWLSRPLFLLSAGLLAWFLCSQLSEQHMLLSLQPAMGCNPLYVNCARISAVNILLAFYAGLCLLLALSRMLTALGHGIQLLATHPAGSSGLHLDELLRTAPLSEKLVLQGLLWFHLRSILAVLWVPLAVAAYVIALFIADGHIDRGDPPLQPDYLLVLILPLLCGALFCLLCSGLVMFGIFLGSRIPSPRISQAVFWLLAAGYVYMLHVASRGAVELGLALDLLRGGRQAWLFSGVTVLLILLLTIRIFRELGETAIRRMALRPQGHVPGSGGIYQNVRHALRNQLGTEAFLRWAILLAPLGYAVLLLGESFQHQPLQYRSDDELLSWYHRYLERSLQRQVDGSPVCGRIPTAWALHSTVDDSPRLRPEEDLLERVDWHFRDDWRWHQLKLDLHRNTEDPELVANSRGAADNRELARMLLEGVVPEEISDPRIRLVYTLDAWPQLEELLDELESVHHAGQEGDDELRSALWQLKDSLRSAIIDDARQCNEAFPLYALGMTDYGDTRDEWLSLLSLADDMPCDTLGVNGPALLAAGIAADLEHLPDMQVMALADSSHILSDRHPLLPDNWMIRSVSYNLPAFMGPHELSHVNRALARTAVANDSGPEVSSWCQDCLHMTMWRLPSAYELPEPAAISINQRKFLGSEIDGDFAATLWFQLNDFHTFRLGVMPGQRSSFVSIERERLPWLAELFSLGRSNAILELESRTAFEELQDFLIWQSSYAEAVLDIGEMNLEGAARKEEDEE
ncbi:MAG: hypothetical protein R3F46_07645 [bacterium]